MTLTYQDLAKKLKAMFGWNYRINGVNIYFTAKGEVNEKALMSYLTGLFSETPIRPRLHRNPHYRTVVYSTPFYLNIYILRKA